MNKLILSAFAVSLIVGTYNSWAQSRPIEDFRELHVEDVLGLESDEYLDADKEILPVLSGGQKFTPKELHQKKEWNVEEKEALIDTKPAKGQTFSIIPWESQDPEEWLNIDKWLNERAIKDKTPLWKLRLRDFSQNEHVGKILQCQGRCHVYRGENKARVQHLSRIHEGDELKTEKDSVAWVYLMDGTLLRIGPLSSVGFLEINWSNQRVLQLVRLNQGHVYWHGRDSREYPLDLAPETDQFSLPLLLREANQTQFERKIFQAQSDSQRSAEVIKLEETAATAQIASLNELKKKNNTVKNLESRFLVVSPAGSLIGKSVSFDYFYYPGGRSYFKKRSIQDGGELALQLRGYTNSELSPINEETWYAIESNGKSFSKVEKVTGELEITELITRRIKTIELAREIWFEKYTQPVVKQLDSAESLALLHGYKLWNEDLQKRFDFLVEYTRRMETTNLRSLENLFTKLEEQGSHGRHEISDSHYQAALKAYLFNLKSRYTQKWMQVREMNDLQYYVWILRHGKN